MCVSACVSVGPGEPALIVGSFLRQGGVGGALGLGAEVGGRWLTEERGCSRHTGRGSQEGNGALRALRNAKGASWRAGVSGVHSRQVGWGQGCLCYSCSSGCGHHDPDGGRCGSSALFSSGAWSSPSVGQDSACSQQLKVPPSMSPWKQLFGPGWYTPTPLDSFPPALAWVSPSPSRAGSWLCSRG